MLCRAWSVRRRWRRLGKFESRRQPATWRLRLHVIPIGTWSKWVICRLGRDHLIHVHAPSRIGLRSNPHSNLKFFHDVVADEGVMQIRGIARMAEASSQIIEGVFGEANSSPKTLS